MAQYAALLLPFSFLDADDFRQTKWDVDNLHRHPDYAPVKKEPEQTADRSKNVSEDNDLPPRPTEVSTRNNNDITMTFDGDGEFGSRFFQDRLDIINTKQPQVICLMRQTLWLQQLASIQMK